MKNKKVLIVVAVFVALAAAFGIGAKLYKDQKKKELSFKAKENYSLFVRDYSPRKGAEEPEVTLVEFLDPECESCRQFHPLIKSIMSEFDGKIQVVVRYATFHGNSAFAVKILEAARKQGKYWETLDMLFQHQPEWGSHHDPRPDLIWNYLPRLGLNMDQIKQDMEDPKIDQMIVQDRQDGEMLGIRGTPTFFVNGKLLENFGYEPLRQMIREELE